VGALLPGGVTVRQTTPGARAPSGAGWRRGVCLEVGLRRRGRRATAARTIDPGTRPPRRSTSPVSDGALTGCRLVSPGLLVTLGVVVSEDSAALDGLGRTLKSRCHALRGFPRPPVRGF
jgi:hypothetical protein